MKKTTNLTSVTPTIDLKGIRGKAGLNQSEFWNKLGVTQSGGSRYESGRDMPEPVQLLVRLAYGTKKQAEKVLKEIRPDLIADSTNTKAVDAKAA